MIFKTLTDRSFRLKYYFWRKEQLMEAAKELILGFKSNRDYKKYSALAAQTEGMIDQLLDLCYTIDYPFPQYSSWLLAHVTDNHFEKIAPFSDRILDAFLDCTDPSTQRNLGNVLQKLPKSSHREGELLDKLFGFLTDNEVKVAMKAYSMYLIVGFMKDYPELKNELKAIIESDLAHQSPAYHGAARKVLKQLEKI